MKVIFWRAVNKGSLRGTFNILLPSGLIIYRCSLIRTHDGHEFVSLPQDRFTDRQGTVKYSCIVGFDTADRKNAFCAKALIALKDYLKQHSDELYTAATIGDYHGKEATQEFDSGPDEEQY